MGPMNVGTMSILELGTLGPVGLWDPRTLRLWNLITNYKIFRNTFPIIFDQNGEARPDIYYMDRAKRLMNKDSNDHKKLISIEIRAFEWYM